ncbi:hypothetical protein GP486_001315 [Trichoglossum hirsutum]|uniref:PPM-type phosphatase domain-containing protein n=1 Tax=Trichoglossum hirsutum TaxID=265104 RepID=A0A9P8LH51_9PEZI|nr:hypothetical protein GP486_001315 [Trichoglossum hirsutum]
MWRATEAIVRADRLCRVRELSRTAHRSLLFTPVQVLKIRPASSINRPHGPIPSTVASKSARAFAFGSATAIIGAGAWYIYRDSEYGANDSNSIPTTSPLASATDPDFHMPNIRGSRPAIVTEASQLRADASAAAVSRKKDHQGRESLGFLNSEQITQILRRNEESYHVDREQGVVRFDLVQVPSNDPIEDDHSEKLLKAPQVGDKPPSGDWMFWAIYDGHFGWATSAKLRQALIGYVYSELEAIHKATDVSLIPEAIDQAIKNSFNRLDHDITYASVEKVAKANSKQIAAQSLSPAISGSCALLSFYDSQTQLLRVACTGDSRAVLGRRNDSGLWSATPLSIDQTGGNPDEAARIRAAHPGEDSAISGGRILGTLEPSRAFGDADCKLSRQTSLHLEKSFFACRPSKHVHTPPYVTAEPVITTTKIEPEKGDFVVMASDGLWEMLSNEEVVGLVGQWIENRVSQARGGGTSQSLLSKAWARCFPQNHQRLPVVPTSNAPIEKVPHRPGQWELKRGHDRFVLEDENAATHLARNALGGSELDLMAGLLMLPTPNSRRFRDDLTITVIFFGEGNGIGQAAAVEKEGIAPIKPKL